MAEPVPAPVADPPAPPVAAPPPPAEPPAETKKWAGKYESTEALEQGIREIAQQAKYPIVEGRAIVGDDGHFQSHEEAEQVYLALQRMATRANTADPPPITAPAEPPAEPSAEHPTEAMHIDKSVVPEGEAATINALLTDVGVTAEDVTKQWQLAGALTPEQYAKFAAKGLAQPVVDDYMVGVQARGELAQQRQATIRQEAAAIVGTDEQLSNLLANAAQFVPADELVDINDRLKNPKQFKGALRDVMAFQKQHMGTPNSQPLIDGQPGAATGGAITTRSDYFATVRKAAGGDKTSQAALMAHRKASGSRFA